MQNNMHITAKWSKSKPEVEFQYDGRLLFFKMEVHCVPKKRDHVFDDNLN